MPLDEINRPLGREPARRRSPYGLWLVRGLAGVALAALLASTAYVGLKRDPEGGEPVAIAEIEQPRRPAETAGLPPQQAALSPAAATAPRGPASARDVENASGVTVMRSGEQVPGAVIITVPDSGTARLAPAPDPRLTERGRHGILPRIGSDGATPAQVYARPLPPERMAKPAGRIAILLGGLGISQSSTSEATTRLPGEISFAFAPYGGELDKAVQRARAEGHEIFLQVPMEPFDYPDNDPGPHTLLAAGKPAENLDKLSWSMTRFTGYVGLVNFLGGRLTSDEAALSPVLREAAGRGLMVVDDGSSARSRILPSAARARVQAFKVDRTLDTVANAAAIDRELARLETLAREQGFALGAASALPVSIERLAAWAGTLEAKGLVLVPVSATPRFRSPGTTTGSLK